MKDFYGNENDRSRQMDRLDVQIDKDPNNDSLYLQRAKLWLYLKDRDNMYRKHALDDVNTAIRINPNNADAYKFRIDINIGDTSSHINDLKQLIQLLPNEKDNYYELIQTYLDLDKYDSAIEICEKLIELKPNEINAYHKLIWAFCNTDNDDGILETYKHLIKVAPNDKYADAYVGMVYARNGQYKEAYKFILSEPTFDVPYLLLDFYYYKGLTLLAMLDYEESIKAFDESISLHAIDNCIDPMDNYYRGFAKFMAKQYDEAQIDYDIADKEEPDTYKPYSVDVYNELFNIATIA